MAASLSLRTQSGTSMSMRRLPWPARTDGSALANVPPGEHFIEVSPRPGDDESASVPITSGGQDITDLVITTTPGKTISGQVIFEGGASSAGPKSLRVNASSPDPGGPQPTRIYDNTQGVVDEKGRFQIRGLYGSCRLQYFSSDAGCGAGLVSQIGHDRRRECHGRRVRCLHSQRRHQSRDRHDRQADDAVGDGQECARRTGHRLQRGGVSRIA